MKILVTGGAGFIGSHTVDALLAAGHEVWVVDNLSTGQESHIEKLGNRFVHDAFNVFRKDELSNMDAVFHFAANTSVPFSMVSPFADMRNNYADTLALARRLSPHQLLVFASSAGAATAKPENFYGVHKLAAEHALRIISQNGGPRTAVLRYANVWGPRQRGDLEGGVVAKWTEAMTKTGAPLVMHGDGNQTRDFIHVSKVVECNLAALEWLQRQAAGNGKRFGTWDVGSGSETRIRDVLFTLWELFNGATTPVFETQPPPLGMSLRSVVSYHDRARTEDELRVKLAGKLELTKELLG